MNHPLPGQGLLSTLRTGLLLAFLCVSAGSGEDLPQRVEHGLLLLHPRPIETGKPIVIATLDSLLVNGNLGFSRPGKQVSLSVNGRELPLEEDGRFAARIPFPKDRLLEFRWGSGLFRHEHTFTLAHPDAPTPVIVPVPAPGWYRTTDRLNLSTAAGASYWLFPPKGTPLEITGTDGGGSTVRLCDGLQGWLPPDSPLTPLLTPPRRPVRVGSISRDGRGLRIPCPGGPLPARLESLPTQGLARLRLPDALCAIDRVHLDPAGPLQHLDWEPHPGPELELRLQWRPGRVDGIGLAWQGDNLRVSLNERERSLKGWRIVLDPGHGGAELGCVGASGTTEAQVNLLLAFELGRLLEEAGARVSYTRTDERVVSLPDRVACADSVDADFFLSLHHNSTTADGNPRANRGFTVFYWNAFSAEPARALHRALAPGPLADDGLLWRSLAVCRQEARPALLLEAGYLIHPEDESLILDPRIRHLVASRILSGLRDYLKSPELP